ncbi:MAG: dethiobiotin synthase [Rickettsiales bacterium]
MRKIYFVAGSGTDVGKTFLTCALIRECRRQGIDVDAVKPLMTGFDSARADASDAGRIALALGEGVEPETIGRISPLRFRAPQSPDIAAAREGKGISLRRTLEATRVRESAQIAFVETIGGACVPIDAYSTVTEWIAAANHPVIFVAGVYLGGLSHAVSGCRALGRAGATIACVVVNPGAAPQDDVITEEFSASLAPHVGAPCMPPDASAILRFLRSWRA